MGENVLLTLEIRGECADSFKLIGRWRQSKHAELWTHNTPWSRWTTAAEDHTGCCSGQLKPQFTQAHETLRTEDWKNVVVSCTRCVHGTCSASRRSGSWTAKSTATAWCYHVNISEMSPASCWIFAMTNQRSSEGFNPGKVYLMSVYSRKQVSMRMSSSVNREQDREVYQSKIPPKTTCIFKLMFISSHSFLFYTRTL